MGWTTGVGNLVARGVNPSREASEGRQAMLSPVPSSRTRPSVEHMPAAPLAMGTATSYRLKLLACPLRKPPSHSLSLPPSPSLLSLRPARGAAEHQGHPVLPRLQTDTRRRRAEQVGHRHAPGARVCVCMRACVGVVCVFIKGNESPPNDGAGVTCQYTYLCTERHMRACVFGRVMGI